MKGRCNDDAKAGRKGAGHAFRDERIGTERQVGSVMIERTNGQNEPRITLELQTNFGPRQVVQLI
jgi:hypothetical protein